MSISGISGVNFLAAANLKSKDDKANTGIFTDMLSNGASSSDAAGLAAPAKAPSASSVADTSKPKESASEKFMEYMKQTPEERMVTAWLASHGIDKEKFDAMTPEDQQAVMAQMKQEMQDRMTQNTTISPANAKDVEPQFLNILV